MWEMAKQPPTHKSASADALPSSPRAWADWQLARVEADTAEMSLRTFTVQGKHRMNKQLTPSKALENMPGLDAMSESYRTVYEIYLNKNVPSDR